jgi:hypothetical protein
MERVRMSPNTFAPTHFTPALPFTSVYLSVNPSQ